MPQLPTLHDDGDGAWDRKNCNSSPTRQTSPCWRWASLANNSMHAERKITFRSLVAMQHISIQAFVIHNLQYLWDHVDVELHNLISVLQL